MRRIYACRGHWNQAAFVEHAAAVYNEVTNPALGRIDNNSIEGSDPGSRLGAHVERLDERRLEAAIVHETKLGSSSFVVHHERIISNPRAKRPRGQLQRFFALFPAQTQLHGLSWADLPGELRRRARPGKCREQPGLSVLNPGSGVGYRIRPRGRVAG
jgi:hypothetical protein